jgi:hypothetical protein
VRSLGVPATLTGSSDRRLLTQAGIVGTLSGCGLLGAPNILPGRVGVSVYAPCQGTV